MSGTSSPQRGSPQRSTKRHYSLAADQRGMSDVVLMPLFSMMLTRQQFKQYVLKLFVIHPPSFIPFRLFIRFVNTTALYLYFTFLFFWVSLCIDVICMYVYYTSLLNIVEPCRFFLLIELDLLDKLKYTADVIIFVSKPRCKLNQTK